MQQRKIYVVVPNWNGLSHVGSLRLGRCFDSLLAQRMPAEIVVVDNGSADDSVAFITSRYPQIKVIRLPRNRGFAGGVNAGIKYALQRQADFVALFNNDAVADADWLAGLLDAISRHRRIGIVAAKLLKDRRH